MANLTPGVGSQIVAGIAIEVTPGTYLAPTDWFRVETMPTLKYDPKRQGMETANGTLIAEQEMVELDGDVKGDISIPLRADEGWAVLGTMFQDVVTGTAVPYTHTLVPRAPVSFSLTIQRNGKWIGYAGLKGNKAVLSVNHSTAAKAVITVEGTKKPQDVASGTPVFPSDNLAIFTFSHLQPALLIANGATPVVSTDDWEITLGSDNQANYGAGGAGLPTSIIPGIQTATWKFAKLFSEDAEYELFETAMMTPGTIQLAFHNGANRQLTIASGGAYYPTHDFKGGVKDKITEDYEVKTLPDTTGKLVSLVLVNSRSTAYVA
jgi:hypothetical protein